MKTSKHLLVYYSFQLEQTNEYNICKYTADYEHTSDIKIIHVLKCFPFDALSGNYHFRFKSEFKEQNENVVAWIDISNLESKVPLFNNAVYVKVLKLRNKVHNKLFTQEKLAKAAVGKPATQQSAKPKNPSPSPVPAPPRTLSPSPASNKKVENVPLFEVNLPTTSVPSGKSPAPADPRHKSPVQNTSNIDLMFQTDTAEAPAPTKPAGFDLTTKQKLQVFNKQIKAEQEQKQRDMQARLELDDIIDKWAYTNKVRNNFRQLLVTVDTLWTYGGWTPINLSELLTEKDLKKYHHKAQLVFHPDKNREVDYKRRYLSKRISSELSESFRKL